MDVDARVLQRAIPLDNRAAEVIEQRHERAINCEQNGAVDGD
jgi:hypothetical protein